MLAYPGLESILEWAFVTGWSNIALMPSQDTFTCCASQFCDIGGNPNYIWSSPLVVGKISVNSCNVSKFLHL